MASFNTAALISAERFYAIFWPLNHRTLSRRAYKLVILMAWTLATLFSTAYILLFRLSPGAFYAFATLYGLLLIVTICGLNIVIWRKMQQKSVPCHQNRDMQIQRLTKALSLVSVGTLSSWIPAIIISFLRFFGQKISSNIFLFTDFIYFSGSFINPMVYALRIPEFRQGLYFFCFRSQENSNTGRNNMAADHNNLKLTFKQEVMEDTKLWLAVEVRRGGARWALRSPPSTFCTNVEHAFLATTLLIFTGNVNKRQYLKVVIQIWRNLAEILFKSHFVKESIKSKVRKRSLRQPGLHAFSARSKLDSSVSCDVIEFPDYALTAGQERTPGLNRRGNQVHESYRFN